MNETKRILNNAIESLLTLGIELETSLKKDYSQYPYLQSLVNGYVNQAKARLSRSLMILEVADQIDRQPEAV